MENTKVQIQYTCPRCNGTRVVYNPLWQEFNVWFNNLEPKPKDWRAASIEWFSALGTHPDREPQNYVCPECEECGFVYRWIPIAEFAELLEAER